jgi:hypothetical protein
VLVLALEARPRLYADASTDRELERVLDWLGSHPALLRLVVDAIALVEEEAA